MGQLASQILGEEPKKNMHTSPAWAETRRVPVASRLTLRCKLPRAKAKQLLHNLLLASVGSRRVLVLGGKLARAQPQELVHVGIHGILIHASQWQAILGGVVFIPERADIQKPETKFTARKIHIFRTAIQRLCGICRFRTCRFQNSPGPSKRFS